VPGPVLVLARRDDLGAWAVAAAIARRRGQHAVVPVRGEQLATGRWVHRVWSTGAQTKVSLAAGPDLVDHEIGVVLNRLEGIAPVRFLRSSERDCAYAGAELQALLVSWLHSLDCPVVNRVDAHGPVGRWPRPRWLRLAGEHGLPIADLLDAPCDAAGWSGPEVVVVGTEAFGLLVPRFGAACVEIAEAADCALAAFRFSAGAEPRLVDVDTMPELSGATVEATVDLLLGDLLLGAQ
jgi:hypothetical protein